MPNTTSNSKIFNIIKKELKIKKISLKDGINKTRNWDSINNMNILLKLESDLKIKFTSKEFNSLNNIKSIILNVRKKVKN
tara:strand:+ start:4135 stop:4374 length:240 start_codon:yes stop_codon:yes gene_type:complete